MKQEKKALLIKYGVCLGIASLITFIVFWIKGFFTDSVAVNIQILADGFFISGVLFSFVAGMMYVSGEGGLIGIGFVLKTVVQAFIPMGRRNHEFYADYRERKLSEKKQASGDHCILVTGLVFLSVSLILTAIWYTRFYNVT